MEPSTSPWLGSAQPAETRTRGHAPRTVDGGSEKISARIERTRLPKNYWKDLYGEEGFDEGDVRELGNDELIEKVDKFGFDEVMLEYGVVCLYDN